MNPLINSFLFWQIFRLFQDSMCPDLAGACFPAFNWPPCFADFYVRKYVSHKINSQWNNEQMYR
jgi:hypothetical protein